MKQGKRPNRSQKTFITDRRLNAENWLVERDTPEQMVIVHRETGSQKVLRKGA